MYVLLTIYRNSKKSSWSPGASPRSWEAGAQNWTEEMIELFRQRRGYDPTPYLPALVGRVVRVSSRISIDTPGASP